MIEQHPAGPACLEQERQGWQCKHIAHLLRIITALKAAHCCVTSCTKFNAVLHVAQRRDNSSRHIPPALERGWKETPCEIASV